MSRVKKSVFVLGFLTMLIGLGWAGAQQAAAEGPPTKQDRPVIWHGNSGTLNTGEVEGASARLLRTDRGINGSIHARDLNPGHVYTLWWIVIDNPENCTSTPCSASDVIEVPSTNSNVTYAGGIVAGRSGKGTLSGHLAAGEMPDGWLTSNFEHPRDAEVHMVVNDHGPAIPTMLGEMLHTYRGGCSTDSLPGIFPDTAKNDGTPGPEPNDCHLYQAAVFFQP